MKITKLQIKRIVEASTEKYDDNKALTPKQGKNLPDEVQKEIIKNAGGDLDESETSADKTSDYKIGLQDGREDRASEDLEESVLGPEEPDNGVYMAGYNDAMSGLAENNSIRENAHRCMDGTMVTPESDQCYVDIVDRIEDAEFHRNSHTCGTENRIYYNGLLKGLRKKRNRLQKTLDI